MRVVRYAALLAFAGMLRAAEPVVAHPSELESIVDAAQTAPTEFQVDALLRLVESGRIADSAWKRELIEKAFEGATTVAAANPRRTIPASARTSQVSFDRLSLQARAVGLMQGLDRKRARALFAGIVKPVPRRLECSDETWDDLAPYYALAAQLVSSFDARERSKQEHAQFAVGVLGGIASVVELPSAGMLLTFPSWNPGEKDLLGAKYAAAIESAAVDGRSFTAVEPALTSVSEKLTAAGYDAVLMQSTQARLLAKAGALDHCAASAENTGGLSSPVPVPGQRAQALAPMSPDAARLRDRWTKLMYGQKESESWRDELAAYLDDLEKLPEESKTEALEGLLVAVPKGPGRDLVQARYLTALQTSPLQQTDRTKWYESVKRLIDSTRSLVPVERLTLLAAIESTGHPVLLLYAKLERTIPTPASFTLATQ